MKVKLHDNLNAFLVLAACGTLSEAAQRLACSPATLSRRMQQLEEDVGLKLFDRVQAGYTLTDDGQQVLEQLEPFQCAYAGFEQWLSAKSRRPQVRVSAGSWTMKFLSRHMNELRQPGDGFDVVFITSEDRLNIKKREIDIGLRSSAPAEIGLASKRLPSVTFAPYTAVNLPEGTDARWIGIAPEFATTSSSRWILENHGAEISTFVSSQAALFDLMCAGASVSVLPCFLGDFSGELRRHGPVIEELTKHQWVTMHDDRRHLPEVRMMTDRIVNVMETYRQPSRRDQPAGVVAKG
ncbi:LysR family transcriptional regulator [Pseudovibrio sp. Tun.PSC04-5.I4]|uniref:LysR family transcriptional regulator n=1 Tax=Pseudovibrio sp. Tun.PSC04-5.I4 TaxID=1798213 RepID=UPI00088DB978|nr:LysR family transcriptional regulator [Pseudovibrio sp. Tun.PSC04-5.I4]SDR19349.1 DNA-binding transcriptional regulator, LysR family [Pseudovibrio sp. Tun.PSC04-5.I4]